MTSKTVRIRGQRFEIEADGDWGGGSKAQAIVAVERALQALSLMKLVKLHLDLEDEQAVRGSLRREHGADEAICDPIRAEFANPPSVDRALGATLHLTALDRPGRIV